MTIISTTATTTSPVRRRRSRRSPEQMIASLQAQVARVRARAAKKTGAVAAGTNAARPTPHAASPVNSAPSNSLHADLQSCVDSFSVDLVDLIQRSTLDAVQRVLGELADRNGSGDATGNEPRFSPISARVPARSANAPAATSATSESKSAAPLTFKAYERMAIERALAESGGNVIEAGQRLKMTKSAIYRRIQALGIRKPSQGGTFEVSPNDPVAKTGGPLSLEAYEKAAILRAIDECGGIVLAAAKLMKTGKSTLYRRMEVLGIRKIKSPGR